MPGIVSYGAYIPYWRLQRSADRGDARQRRRQGQPQRRLLRRGHDVAGRRGGAHRAALGAADGAPSTTVVFATTAPAYLDKTNATAIHAALGLPTSAGAYDAVGAVRSSVIGVQPGRRGAGGLAVLSDIRTGLPGGADEADGGDAAAALLFGDGPGVIAETIGGGIGDRGVPRPLAHAGRRALPPVGGALRRARLRAAGRARPIADALKSAGLTVDDLDHVIVTGLPRPGRGQRAAEAVGARPEALGRRPHRRSSATPAPPTRRCSWPTCSTGPSRARSIAVVQLADGCDVVAAAHDRGPRRATRRRRDRSAQQHRRHARRPDLRRLPHLARLPASASRRGGPSPTARRPRRSLRRDGLEVRVRRQPGRGRLRPPAADAGCSMESGAIDQMDARCAWPTCRPRSPPSPSTAWRTRLSPPVVAAVIDFDGGGRFQCELTDVDPTTVAIGDRVEMTFRRLYTRDGVHNYFWKARPIGPAHEPADGDRRHDMASHGIRDQVAIVGMGCTPFGEHWDKQHRRPAHRVVVGRRSPSAGVTLDDVDAFWLGTMGSGLSGLTLSRPLKIELQAGDPRRELLRHRLRGVPQRLLRASPRGAYDVAMAIGVEKLKDSGYSGLVGSAPAPTTAPRPRVTAPASFCLLAPAYAKKYGVDEAEMKDVLTRIAWKNHHNGALQPAGPVPQGGVRRRPSPARPLVAGPLGIFDCSGVSDGSAAAIIVRAEDAHRYTDNPLYVKALSFVAGPAAGPIDPGYDYTTFPEVVRVGRGRLRARPASPTPGPSWPWPRCTTASRRPSWC